MQRADGSIIIDTKIDESGFHKGLTSMKNIAINGMAAITAAIGAASTAVLKVGSDFEEGMSKVSAISGATGAELEALSEKAKEMGAKTKFSATEASEAMQYMAMAGWKASDMISGIDGIMNLAAASGEELANVSDIVTDALTAFGLQAKDSAHFADVLAKAASNSNTNVAMMGATFKYAAPLAGSLGYSVEDVAVAIGLMANAGIKGEQAGTALRGMLTRMIKPTDEVADVMNKLNIMITNSDGTVKPFSQTIQELRESFVNLTEEEKAQYAASLAGQEAMSGFLAIVNASEADFDKLTDAISHADGASKEMAETMQDNLKGKMTIFKSSLEGLGISAYEKFEKPMKKAMDSAQQSVNTLSREMSSGKLGKSVDKIADGFGDLIAITADLASKAIPLIVNGFAFLVDHSEALTVALISAGSAMAALKGYNSISKVITGIAKSFQTAQYSIKLFEMANTGATVSQAALNGTLTLGETAVALLTGKIKLSTAAHAAWNAVKLADPTMMIVAGVTALAAGLTALTVHVLSSSDAMRVSTRTIVEAKEAYDELEASKQEMLNTSLKEADDCEYLKQQLDALVDSNGKVREGNEARAKYICGELSEALGYEIKMVDGVIQKYDQVSKELDTYIAKMKASAILEAQAETLKQAEQLYDENADNIAEYNRKITEEQEKLNERMKELRAKGLSDTEIYQDADVLRMKTALDLKEGERQALLDTQKKIEQDQATYYENIGLLQEGSLESLTRINASEIAEYDEQGNRIETSLNERISTTVAQLQSLNQNILEEQDEGKRAQLEQLALEKEATLAALQEELDSQIDAVKGATPEQQQAYMDLAIGRLYALKSQSEKYFGISQEEMDNLIAGLNSKDPEVRAKAKEKAQAIYDGLRSKNDKYSVTGSEIISGIIKGIDNESGVLFNRMAGLANGVLNTFKNRLEIRSPSRKFERVSEFIPDGAAKGVENKKHVFLDSIKEMADEGEKAFKDFANADLTPLEFSIKSEQMRMAATVMAGQGYAEHKSVPSPQTVEYKTYITINSPTALSPSEISQNVEAAMRRSRWKL